MESESQIQSEEELNLAMQRNYLTDIERERERKKHARRETHMKRRKKE